MYALFSCLPTARLLTLWQSGEGLGFVMEGAGAAVDLGDERKSPSLTTPTRQITCMQGYRYALYVGFSDGAVETWNFKVYALHYRRFVC